MNKKTAILIPCYNEEQTVGKVIKDFENTFPEADIYVYDNNSTDNTAEIVKDYMKSNDKVHLAYEQRQGKGNVIRSMFRDIEADCYIMVDGDDTYPAESFRILEEDILTGKADMAVGDRLSGSYHQENKRAFHSLGNNLVKGLINKIFGANLNDIMTGARALSRDFAKSYAVLVKGFEIETDMTIFALDKNFKISQHKIDYRDRPEGSCSKLNTYEDGIKVISTIIRLFRDIKPFQFFSAISAGLFAIAFGTFLPILKSYIETGLVPRIPTLIVCIGLALFASLTFFCGVILQVLRRYEQGSFERQLTLLRTTKK